MKKIFIGSILLVLLSVVVIGLGKAFSHVNRKICEENCARVWTGYEEYLREKQKEHTDLTFCHYLMISDEVVCPSDGRVNYDGAVRCNVHGGK